MMQTSNESAQEYSIHAKTQKDTAIPCETVTEEYRMP
jgi:hypothetical protein